MARYIDAEKLWNDRPPFPKDQSDDYVLGFNECMWAFSKLIREQINNAPADVAPRADVAKIIEEVKKKAEAYFWHHDSVATSLFIEFCDELKKKYAESEDTNVPTKDYYTPEEVRAMSQSEVRQNIEAIKKSMKKWR